MYTLWKGGIYFRCLLKHKIDAWFVKILKCIFLIVLFYRLELWMWSVLFSAYYACCFVFLNKQNLLQWTIPVNSFLSCMHVSIYLLWLGFNKSVSIIIKLSLIHRYQIVLIIILNVTWEACKHPYILLTNQYFCVLLGPMLYNLHIIITKTVMIKFSTLLFTLLSFRQHVQFFSIPWNPYLSWVSIYLLWLIPIYKVIKTTMHFFFV